MQQISVENLVRGLKSRSIDRESDPIATKMRSILKDLGEDPRREGLRDTPKRYSKAMRFLTSGYEQDPIKVVGRALFNEKSSELVLVRDIEFFSLCEHHMLPFYGKAHVAYIPNGKIIGLSKIPRLLNVFARRFQVQERLTTQLAETLEQVLKPHGVAVVIEAAHMCMMMRGVEKQHSDTLTSCLRGSFKTDLALRQEFFSILRTRS